MLFLFLGGIACLALVLALFPTDDLDEVGDEFTNDPIQLVAEPDGAVPLIDVTPEMGGKIITLTSAGRKIARLRIGDFAKARVEVVGKAA